ncbi:uncharacterized protein METZ01_LOCUS138780, partial [marine metagenome]
MMRSRLVNANAQNVELISTARSNEARPAAGAVGHQKTLSRRSLHMSEQDHIATDQNAIDWRALVDDLNRLLRIRA